MRKHLSEIVGVLGVIACVFIYLQAPSWPTPDKLLVLLTFVFMIFKKGVALLKRLSPFVVLLLVYESFRGLVPHLNGNVNILWMPGVDVALFGTLPTITLQNWLWNGQVQWYDFVIYIVYMLHFVLPVGLALLVWRLRPQHYWRVIASFIVLSFAGFLTFLAFPAAPPWMAARDGHIPPITRVSSEVWASLGVKDFPSVYNKISPNPVAAVPSLHAAYATLLAVIVITLFRSKWRYLILVYPVIIYFGTVYQGEHYVVDALAGIVYAGLAYRFTPNLILVTKRLYRSFTRQLKQPKLVSEEIQKSSQQMFD